MWNVNTFEMYDDFGSLMFSINYVECNSEAAIIVFEASNGFKGNVNANGRHSDGYWYVVFNYPSGM